MSNNDKQSVDWCANPPEWFANQLRMAHLRRWSSSPRWQRAVTPDMEKLARQLGRLLADHALERSSMATRTSPATTKPRRKS